MSSFNSLSLSPELKKALDVMGFENMTPVQEITLPYLLEGKDVIGQARTGSGKTAAFGLAILARLQGDDDDTSAAKSAAERSTKGEGNNESKNGIRSMVLCPTRELADQVTAELRRLAKFVPNIKIVTLCGGVPARTQAPALVHPPHIIVGTPGRIFDHLERGNLDFSKLQTLVLDEADRMLDMGFADAIADITRVLSRKRQTLLFSATIPDPIRKMSKRYQRNPEEITVDSAAVSEDIEEFFYEVLPAEKTDAVAALLREFNPSTALVFCVTRKDTNSVCADLARRGYSVLALHGDMEQRDRDEVFLQFSNQSCTVLVATDVAARGLDVEALGAVISFELPRSTDIHIHRTGRTGRAGRKGLALHLCAPQEKPRADAIERFRTKDGAPELRWARIKGGNDRRPQPAPMVTLVVNGGRKDKVRAGDILGALTGEVGLDGKAIGKIDIFPSRTYVAVKRDVVKKALDGLSNHKIKGRKFRVSELGKPLGR